jgi:hypothetical protein
MLLASNPKALRRKKERDMRGYLLIHKLEKNHEE